jgi:hypothetical protein
MSAVVPLRSRARRAPARGENSPARSYGFAWDDGSGQAYNQEAFRYFLDIERRRSQVSARPFLLLLVGLRRVTGQAEWRVRSAVAGKLFSALRLSLRETDFIGWYREGRLTGAVLTHCGDLSDAEISRQARDRVIRAMAERLPKDIVDRLHVRVCRVPSINRS